MKSIYFSCVLFLACSCKSSVNDTENNEIKNENKVELIDSNKIDANTLSESQIPKGVKTNLQPNYVANKIKVEKIYGEQWDFCNCIRINDSLDRVVKQDGEIGDAFMKRFEEADIHCKIFLGMNKNRTPAERAAHEKNVKDCLRKK
jgi:hypothetical protein